MHTRRMSLVIAAVVGASVATAQREELSELRPDDCSGVGGFGFGVDLEGTRALVGGYGDSVNPAAVWLFDVTDPADPVVLRAITAADGAPNDYFGTRPLLHGDLVIVNAPGHAAEAGAVYVFDAATGEQLSKLAGPDPRPGDRFGSLAAHGDLLLVGAGGDDDDAEDAGKAFLFDIADPANPLPLGELGASDAAAFDGFGGSVALWADLAAVSAPRDDSRTGAVYLFDVSDPAQPVQLSKIIASDPMANDRFGSSLAMNSGLLIVGTPVADDYAGSVYVFDISDPLNPMESGMLAPSGDAPSYFGSSVALEGTRILVGAIGINNGVGAAYLFDTTTLEQLVAFYASDGGGGDQLGESVAISGELAIAGAPEHGHGCWGAAYLFDAAHCATDVNDDWTNDSRDVIAFLNLWASDNPAADWNGDGSVDSADVTAFLNEWVAGC